jgi:hypothetical protein
MRAAQGAQVRNLSGELRERHNLLAEKDLCEKLRGELRCNIFQEVAQTGRRLLRGGD